jgi:cysteine desulfurase
MDFLQKFFVKKERIYLDYAAATPLVPEARREMERYWTEDFYNPNSIYKEGTEVRKKVEEYRTRIARLLNVAPEAIHFTSGGTEANVLAVRGVKEGKVVAEEGAHPSVTDAIRERDHLSTWHVDRLGEVVLISGIVPTNKLGRRIREERKKSNAEYPLVHIDASQTAAYYDVGLEKLAADLLTLDAAKLGGPKGIGALAVRRGVKLDLPPRGTPAVPLIAGFCVALERAARDREAERTRLTSLSERFKALVEKGLPQAQVSLAPPNIVHVSVPGLLPELLVLALDRRGILASAGPACESYKPEPAETPVRFSLGWRTTEKELNEAAKILCEIASNLLK